METGYTDQPSTFREKLGQSILFTKEELKHEEVGITSTGNGIASLAERPFQQWRYWNFDGKLDIKSFGPHPEISNAGGGRTHPIESTLELAPPVGKQGERFVHRDPEQKQTELPFPADASGNQLRANGHPGRCIFWRLPERCGRSTTHLVTGWALPTK